MLTKHKLTSLVATVSIGVLSLVVVSPRKAAKERTKSIKETSLDEKDQWFI